MIGLDTNIVIRFLVQDDMKQAKLANKLLQNRNEVFFICNITLCEIVWVLETCYNQSKDEIIEVVQELMLIENMMVENEDVIFDALDEFKKNKVKDFSDCLIGKTNYYEECDITYTFNNDASKLSTFKLLK